jgi:hypothetical protein
MNNALMGLMSDVSMMAPGAPVPTVFGAIRRVAIQLCNEMPLATESIKILTVSGEPQYELEPEDTDMEVSRLVSVHVGGEQIEVVPWVGHWDQETQTWGDGDEETGAPDEASLSLNLLTLRAVPDTDDVPVYAKVMLRPKASAMNLPDALVSAAYQALLYGAAAALLSMSGHAWADKGKYGQMTQWREMTGHFRREVGLLKLNAARGNAAVNASYTFHRS